MANSFVAVVKVTVPQLAQCVHCDTHFVYLMKRSGAAESSGFVHPSDDAARAAAEAYARAELDRKLNNPELCDVVPCPNCWRFQPYMRAVSAERIYSESRLLAIAASLLGTLFSVVAGVAIATGRDSAAGVYWLGGIGLAIAAFGFLFGLYTARRKRTHDPDLFPLEKRKSMGEGRTIQLAGFDKYQEVRTATAFQEHRQDRWRNTPWGKAREVPTEPFVFVWWLEPTHFLNGTRVQMALPTGRAITIDLPADAQPGWEYIVPTTADDPEPFRVQFLAMRVHPDELRLD
jgi:hypothetical protein